VRTAAEKNSSRSPFKAFKKLRLENFSGIAFRVTRHGGGRLGLGAGCVLSFW
jgi:hypothetical protein